MFDINITRFPNGSTNSRDTETLSDLIVEDRTKVADYTDDFFTFNPADFVTGPVGAAGGTTFAAVDGDCGIIQAVTNAVAFGGWTLRPVNRSFTLTPGLRVFGHFRCSADGPVDIIVGLINNSTTGSGIFTSGIINSGTWVYASGANGQVNVFTATQSNLTTNQIVPGVLTLNPSFATPFVFKFYWDGGVYGAAPGGRIVWEVSGAGAQVPVRVSFGGTAATPLPPGFPATTLLWPSVGFMNPTPSAVARSCNIDLISIIKERVNVLMTPPV
jgi:hypothetical protein